MANTMKLTKLQLSFVEAFMKTMNATEAVRLSGSKTKYPDKVGFQLRNNPAVKAEIDRRLDKREKNSDLSADYIKRKLMKIADDTEETNPQAALRALELMGKTLGLFRDRTEISGPDGEAIKTEQRVRNDADDFTSRLSRLIERSGTDEVSEFPKPGSASGT